MDVEPPSIIQHSQNNQNFNFQDEIKDVPQSTTCNTHVIEQQGIYILLRYINLLIVNQFTGILCQVQFQNRII